MSARTPQHHGLAKAVAAVLVMAFATPLVAQDAPGQQREEEEATTLSAVTVTAQKREEAMQDVPIMVTALPEQLLRDTGVRDVKDVQVLVPGLTVTSTQSEAQTTARIRGIGTVGDNAGLVVAEIELGAADEVFARPDWLGAEVTAHQRYFNLALAALLFDERMTVRAVLGGLCGSVGGG